MTYATPVQIPDPLLLSRFFISGGRDWERDHVAIRRVSQLSRPLRHSLKRSRHSRPLYMIIAWVYKPKPDTVYLLKLSANYTTTKLPLEVSCCRTRCLFVEEAPVSHWPRPINHSNTSVERTYSVTPILNVPEL